jgi:WD40 repeat protein
MEPRTDVQGAIFSPDSSKILVHYLHFNSDHSVGPISSRLIDAKTGNELVTFPGRRLQESKIAFLPNGKEILTAHSERIYHYGDRNPLEIWDLAKGKIVRKFGEETDIARLAISPDGKLLLTGHGDGRILLWDLKSGKKIRAFDTDKQPSQSSGTCITTLFFAPDGKQAFSRYSDVVQAWNVATGKQIDRPYADFEDIEQNTPPRKPLEILLHLTEWHPILAHATNKNLVCIGVPTYNRVGALFRVWDFDTVKIVGSFDGHEGCNRVVDAALTADGAHAISAAAGGVHSALCKWEVATGKEVWAMDLGNSGVVAFSQDGKLALTRQWDGTIRLHDLDQPKELWHRGPP